jgi:hypothetical protein
MSRPLTAEEIRAEFDKVWPKLLSNRTATKSEFHMTDEEAEALKEDIFHQWLAIRRPEQCRIHTGYIMNGYPVVSVRLNPRGPGSSVKLQLHQVPARRDEYTDGMAQSWHEPELCVASHTCGQKLCLVCAVRETASKNIHRNYCLCYILVDRKLVHCCPHLVRSCRTHGTMAYYNGEEMYI